MHRTLLLSFLPLILSLASCETSSPTGPRIAIEVAPLELTGVTDASYRLTVRGEDGSLVWDRTLSSSQFGDSRGALSYVGPCDPTQNPSQVTVQLLSLADTNGPLPADAWVAPPPLTRPATCAANADTLVTFDLTIARSARQGFFDIGVTFDDIFCSAKFDCGPTTSANDDLILLHDPRTGERGPTAVLAFACTPTPDSGANTHLYLDDLEITCDNGLTIVAVDSPGLVDLTLPPSTDPNGILYAAAVYRGLESLASKAYWNVALGLNREAFDAVGTCTLRARATASDDPLPLQSGFAPTQTLWPYIEWNVPLVANGERTCTTHPIDADDRVRTVYPPTPTPIDRGFDPDGPQLAWSTPTVTFRIGESASNTLELRTEFATLPFPSTGTVTLHSEDPNCVPIPATAPLTAGSLGSPVTLSTPSTAPCTTRLVATHPLYGTAIAEARVEAPLIRLAGSPNAVSMLVGGSRQAEVHLERFGDDQPVAPPQNAESVTLTVADPGCATAPTTVTLGEAPTAFTITGLTAGCSTSLLATHPIFGTFTIGIQIYTETSLELRSQPLALALEPRATNTLDIWLARPGALARVAALPGTAPLQITHDNPSCIEVPDTLPLTAGQDTHTLTVSSSTFTPCTATLTFFHPDIPPSASPAWGGETVLVTVLPITPSFAEDPLTALAQGPVATTFTLSRTPPPGAGDIVFTSSDEACAPAPPPIAISTNTDYALELVHGTAPLPCTTTLTAQTVFGDATLTLTLGDTPTLAFAPDTIETNVGQTLRPTLMLFVAGTPVRFPLGAGSATLASDTPGCVTLPASASLSSTGLTNSFFATAGATPCVSTVTATHPLYGVATLAWSTLPPPDLGPLRIDTFEHADRVGAGLQARFMVSRTNLGLGLPSVTVTVTSNDPAITLSLTDSGPGTSSVEANILTSEGGRYLYVRGAPGAVGSSVTLTATHPRYDPATLEVEVVAPVFEPTGIWRTRSTTSSSTLSQDPFQVLVGVLADNGSLVRQNVSPSAAPLAVDLTISDPTLALLRTTSGVGQTRSIAIGARRDISPNGVAIGGVELVYPVPPQSGTFTVTASSPDSVPTPRDHTEVVLTATDNTLEIVDTTNRYRVAGGLQAQYRVNLTGNHPAMSVRIESVDPSMALLAPDATSLGSPTLDLAVAANVTSATFWVHGVPGRLGPVELTASAPNFIDASIETQIVSGLVELTGVTTSRTGSGYTQIADDGIVMSTGLPRLDNPNLFDTTQTVAPSFAPLTLTATKTPSDAATLRRGAMSGDSVTVELAANTHTSTDQVLVDSAYPAVPGTFTLTASAPHFLEGASASRATVNYNITPVSISMSEVQNPNTGNRVGAGLSLRLRLTTNQTPPGSPMIRIRSSDPSLATVADAPTSPGGASLLTAFSTSSLDFYVHGIAGQTGTVTLIAECANPDTCIVPTASLDIAVVPVVPIVTMSNPTILTSTVETEADVAVRVELAVSSVSNGLVAQVVNGTTGTLPVALALSQDGHGIASLVNSAGSVGTDIIENIAAGISRTPGIGVGTIYFRLSPRVPAGTYPLTVSAEPPGSTPGTFNLSVSSSQAVLTIGTPTSGHRVGAGLEHTVAITLSGVTGSTGTIDVTVTSADSSVLGLAGAAGNAPVTSYPLTFSNANLSRTIYVVGAGGSATPASTSVTASALGATSSTANWEVVRPTLRLVTNANQTNYLNPLTLLRTANGVAYRVRSGVFRTDGTWVLQNVAYYGMTVTVTSDNTDIIAVGPTVSTATGSSFSVGIGSPFSVSDVFALDPRGTAGTTSLHLFGQNVFMPTALEYGTVTVTAN